MKLIIAGGRTQRITPSQIEMNLLNCGIPVSAITEVVSGKAKGIDACGERFASDNHIPIKEFPADWDKYGKAAGPIRNKEMAEYADALLLIWDGKSPGSKNMKATMKKLNKPVFEKIQGRFAPPPSFGNRVQFSEGPREPVFAPAPEGMVLTFNHQWGASEPFRIRRVNTGRFPDIDRDDEGGTL